MIRLMCLSSCFMTIYWGIVYFIALIIGENSDVLGLFFAFSILSLVLYVIDKEKRNVLDLIVIIIIWVISAFYSWMWLMGAAWDGESGDPMKYIIGYFLILLILTKYNKKIDLWLKRK